MSLSDIKTFDQLLPWLSTNLNWPMDEIEIAEETAFEDLTFEYEAKELGLKQEDIAHVREIRQLRPLVTNQPWGIFFVNFEDKKIPVGVLKRILGGLTLKKRQSANKSEQKAWTLHDLLFISASGNSGARELSFLHFAEENGGKNKTVLKELGWDKDDTQTKLNFIENTLKTKLTWPDNVRDADHWRSQWSAAFTTTHGITIKTAKELTKRLAELAGAIRKAVSEVLACESKDGGLTQTYEKFKQTIFHNLTPADFADMYAQTVSYGLLAKQIERALQGLDTKELSVDDVTMVQNVLQPFLGDMLKEFLAIGGNSNAMNYNELGVDEVRELLNSSDMKAVLLDFGNKNPHEDPVLHFYEHFLKDYDSIMREQRGVYYTPLPVVRFIVRSVHEILQNEFGLADGLADVTKWGEMIAKYPEMQLPEGAEPAAHFVQILDPATGTGTFLVEVIDQIEKQLKTKWKKAGKSEADILRLWNEYVPAHLLPRLNGFELMMAPYAIAHIKLGMKLHETGYRPQANSPRVRVYLTNTLEEPTGFSGQSTMSFITESLALEATGADDIKAKTPITVVVGNPPYSKHNENRNPTIKNRQPTLIGRLINDYYAINGQPLNETNSKNIKQDENKFIRYAEHRIDTSGAGIVGYISASGYLYGTTMRGMRWHLMQTFNKIELVDLHGSIERDKVTPDGKKDENVFAIRQGVVISLMRKLQNKNKSVLLIDVWGEKQSKNNWLFKNSPSTAKFETLDVRPANYLFAVREYAGLEEYQESFEPCNKIYPENNTGYKTHRDHFALSFSEIEMQQRLDELRNQSISDVKIREKYEIPDTRDWKLKSSRQMISTDTHWQQYLSWSLYRPFDHRFSYLNEVAMDWPRFEINHHMMQPNLALITSRQTQDLFGCLVSNLPAGHKSVAAFDINYLFPLYLYPNQFETEIRPNLDAAFAGRIAAAVGLAYESGIKVKQVALPLAEFQPAAPKQAAMPLPDPQMGRGDLAKNFGPRDVFDYIYAVLHSPTYRTRYADFLKSDFPRIPLPCNAELFRELVARGKQLVALHLLDEKQAEPLANPETRYIGKGEARVEKKPYPKYENGKVMINASCWFEDVPPEVWNFHIGGYQVCEKWLKDRAATGGKTPKPGRVLTEADILHYRRVTIALRETIRLMSQIDTVIDAQGGWPSAFASGH